MTLRYVTTKNKDTLLKYHYPTEEVQHQCNSVIHYVVQIIFL